MKHTKKIIVYIVSITVIFALLDFGYHRIYHGGIDLQEIELEKGKLNGTKAFIDNNEVIELNGEWEFYPNQLLTSDKLGNQGEEQVGYVVLPTELNKISPAYTEGYGTLRGVIHVEDLDEIYALKIKYFSTAYKVYIDGKELKEVGKVSQEKEGYESHLASEIISVFPQDHDVEIVLQYANFHHRRVRLNTLYFGKIDDIHRVTDLGIIRDSVLFGALFLMGIFIVVFFIFSRNNKSFLYLGTISLLLSMRLGIVNERILVRVFPSISGELLMKMGYLPVLLFPVLIVFYIREVLDVPKKPVIEVGLRAYGLLITGIVLFGTVKIYDWILGCMFVLICIITVGLACYQLIKIKISSEALDFMILGILVLTIGGVRDFLREFDYVKGQEILSYSFVVFIGLQSFFLAWNAKHKNTVLTILCKENGEMIERIKGMNNELEQRIEQRTLELARANKKLERLTYLDALTGIDNRRSFDKKMHQWWINSRKERKSLALLVIDIDNFKGYNDCYGHLAGDECLKKVSCSIKSIARKTDGLIFRYGGEEFMVAYYDKSRERVIEYSQQMCQAINALQIENPPKADRPYVSVSIGVNYDKGWEMNSLIELIEMADEALYVAKSNGKNQVVMGKNK